MTAVACPRCGSSSIALLAPYGTTLMTCQCRCLQCRQIFEALRQTVAPETSTRAAEPKSGDA
jgi:hypothetical protein